MILKRKCILKRNEHTLIENEESFDEDSNGEESKSVIKESKQRISLQPSFQKLPYQSNYRSSLLKNQIALRKESLLHQLFKSAIPSLKILQVLNSGDSFGERAIASKFKKREAYVQAKEDCHLLYLNKQDYLNIIGNKKAQQIQKIALFLSNFKFLEGWQMADLKSLSGYFFIDKFAKGEYIFKEGDKCQNVYIVKKGDVNVMKEVNFELPQVENLEESRLKKFTKTIEIAQLQEGEIFGEEASIQYDSKRCFSVQIKSMKAHILRINAQKLYDKLWDPSSKNIYLQQVNQKLKWRSDRFNELVQKQLKQLKVIKDLDDQVLNIQPEVKKIIETPDKMMVLNKKFLNSEQNQSDKKYKNQKKNDNIILVNREDRSSRSLLKEDLHANKEDFLKKFPVAWHLRQQELTLKKSVCSSPNSKISDGIQTLRPCTAKIEEKRTEIFNTRIKSGTLNNNFIIQNQQEKEKSIMDLSRKDSIQIDLITSNPGTPMNKRIQSANLNKSKQFISNSPQQTPQSSSNKNQFSEELNQIFSLNNQNFSKFHPMSSRNSQSKIPYFDYFQEKQPDLMTNINYQDIIKSPLQTRKYSQVLVKQSSIEQQKVTKQIRPQSHSIHRENSIIEEEVNKQQKQYLEQKSSQLRGFSPTLKIQSFYHTMSIKEESEEKRIFYLRKYLEEKKQAQSKQKRKGSSIDNQTELNQQVSKSIQSNGSISQRGEKDESKSNTTKAKNNPNMHFSLFDEEYSKYSKEEQEKLRNYEKRFNIGLDRNLQIQTGLIERDMMEALSVKGQQIAKDINVEIKNENENFILKLFQKKDKLQSNSLRQQRTKKGTENKKIKEEIKKFNDQQKQIEKLESIRDTVEVEEDDVGFNFTKAGESHRSSLKIENLEKNNSQSPQIKQSENTPEIKPNESSPPMKSVENTPKLNSKDIVSYMRSCGNSPKTTAKQAYGFFKSYENSPRIGLKEDLHQNNKQDSTNQKKLKEDLPIKLKSFEIFSEQNIKDMYQKPSQSVQQQNIKSAGSKSSKEIYFNNKSQVTPQISKPQSPVQRSYLSSRPQTAGQRCSFVSFQENCSSKLFQNDKQKLNKILSFTSKNASRTITQHNTEIQALEEHKKIIDTQFKKQKRQTNAYEFLNKLMFENKNEETNKNYMDSKQAYFDQQNNYKPITTSVYDKKLKQLLIKRSYQFIPQ